jgi:regulator of sirC expression with transglutaminase-like and TPR domain
MWKSVVCAGFAIVVLAPDVAAQIRQQPWDACADNARANHDTAIEACTMIIESGRESSRNQAMAYYNRGNARAAKSQHDQAIADFTEAIKLDASDASYFYNRGNAWARKNERDRAIADFTAAINLRPNHASAYYNRGNQWRQKRQYETAANDYGEAVKHNPQHANAWGSRCWMNVLLDRLQVALSDCDAALKIRADADDSDSRGFVHLRLGNYDKAIADYDVALAANPRLATSLFGRGTARVRKGDSEGTADIGAAVRINSGIAREMERYGLK